MKFRTEYKADRASLTLDPSKPVVLVGSCFSQNMAAQMSEHGWEAVLPCGTLYNPFSIGLALDMLIDEKRGVERFEKSLFHADGLWNSHRFDSSFSSSNKEDCIEEFKLRQKMLSEKLAEGNTMIVTFGTSICYNLRNNEGVVGNCHKQPATNYYTQRLTDSSILSTWEVINKELQEKFPDLKIIFTVSPVRHLKDGFTANSRSKAVLLLAVEEICQYNENCFYFPAFEILNDDLRDYRFYASDLSHPSQEAIEYIWEKFCDTYIDEDGRRMLLEGEKRIKAQQHRPKRGALGKPLSQG